MSMTSVSLSSAIRPAKSAGSSGGAAAGAAAGWRGGVHSTFGAGAVPATPRTPGVPHPSSTLAAAAPRVTARNAWEAATLRAGTAGGRVAHRASIVLCTKKGLGGAAVPIIRIRGAARDRKSTRLNSSHGYISYAVFCLKKKKKKTQNAS